MKKDELVGACRMDERYEKCKQMLDVKSEGMRPVQRPKFRWEDNIKVDMKEMRCDVVDWILSQDAVQWWVPVNTEINLWVP
jgi:hypothetical protein